MGFETRRRHGPEVSQRDADPAQRGDKPGRRQLPGRVSAITRVRAHAGGRQEPQLVIQPQCPRRQTGTRAQSTRALRQSGKTRRSTTSHHDPARIDIVPIGTMDKADPGPEVREALML
jgi:hypothetical protein